MRFIITAAILGATLALTTSAALAEGVRGGADSPYGQALAKASPVPRTLSAADTSDRSNCPHLNCREGGHKL